MVEVSEFEALHFSTQHPLHFTTTNPDYFTAFHNTALHCTASPQLRSISQHWIHYTAPSLLHCTAPTTSLYFTVLHRLQCNQTAPLHFTAMLPLYCILTTPLHCIHYTAPPLLTAPALLHCTS